MIRLVNHHNLNECNNSIVIEVVDEPGAGGANHLYRIWAESDEGRPHLRDIRFQNGPIPENGINGLTQEALLAIVIDRLESFQKGMFPNEHNRAALNSCRDALGFLHGRTEDRIARDVEGKMEA